LGSPRAHGMVQGLSKLKLFAARCRGPFLSRAFSAPAQRGVGAGGPPQNIVRGKTSVFPRVPRRLKVLTTFSGPPGFPGRTDCLQKQKKLGRGPDESGPAGAGNFRPGARLGGGGGWGGTNKNHTGGGAGEPPPFLAFSRGAEPFLAKKKPVRFF